jgi:hypothetical protein
MTRWFGLRGLGLFALVLALPATAALAAPAAGSLGFRSTFAHSTEALTTEKAWQIDADEPNPHRQRWLLGRKVEYKELAPREMRVGKDHSLAFGVAAAGIESATVAYLRPDGPWYRPISEFPCGETDPGSWFATLAGSRLAADHAAKAWDRLLDQERHLLSSELNRLTAATPGAALEKARLLFEGWLARLDAIWRAEGRAAARKEEWKSYEREARAACGAAASVEAASAKPSKKKKPGSKPVPAADSQVQPVYPVYEDEYVPPTRNKTGPVPWEQMMEPPATGELGRAGSGADEIKLLARAPAKTWDGLFSVRLNITVGARKLNGKFLIDSGSGTSIISPDFLANQGILPAWISVPTAPLRRIPWGGSGLSGEGGLAPVVSVDKVELGNLQLAIKDFALFDTEFFAQPDHPTSCCDGILGTDFLRRYVVEIQPGPPAEVKLWPAESFHLGPNPDSISSEQGSSQWFETALTPSGEPISNCFAGRPNQSPKLVGARWDTGRESALYIHLPWQKPARAGRPSGWEIRCGSAGEIPIASDIPAFFPQPDGSPESAAIHAKVPGFTIGMELLSRGRVFFDFPHGRIWFPDRTSDEPLYRDRSGLSLRYEFIPGQGDARALVVKGIAKGSPAEALRKRGLKPGMVISQIAKIDADSLDAWTVRRHLAGVYGDQVYVQWKTPKKGLMLGLMKVR